MKPVAIVGAGHGGVQVAAQLRAEGYDGPVMLFGAEQGVPYHRPPLSKAFMDHGDVDRLCLRPELFFREQGIDYRAGSRISDIDRQQRMLITEAGERISYAHLILATGSTPFRPPLPGANLPGLSSLRGLEEAIELRARLAPGKKAVVLGAGFIGLEFAAMARQKGLEVIVVEAASRVLARVVSPSMSSAIEARHRSSGVAFRLGASVAEILPGADGTAQAVVLSDGTRLDADIVLMATGARPNTVLAEKAGLAISNGIAVDALLTTSDPDISALGDCASFPDPFGLGHVRLECVQAANDHARCIAQKLVGKKHPYNALAWFWSDQGDVKLQIAGFDSRQAIAAEDLFSRSLGGSRFIACRFEDDRLKAVETLDAPAQHMAARKLLAGGKGPSLAEVMAVDGDLQALLRAHAPA